MSRNGERHRSVRRGLKLFALPTAVCALAIGATYGIGEAHHGSASAGCIDGRPTGTADFDSYSNGPTQDTFNSARTFVDGALVDQETFSASYSKTFSLGSPASSHTFRVAIKAFDGPQFDYDQSFEVPLALDRRRPRRRRPRRRPLRRRPLRRRRPRRRPLRRRRPRPPTTAPPTTAPPTTASPTTASPTTAPPTTAPPTTAPPTASSPTTTATSDMGTPPASTDARDHHDGESDRRPGASGAAGRRRCRERGVDRPHGLTAPGDRRQLVDAGRRRTGCGARWRRAHPGGTTSEERLRAESTA